MQPNANVRQSSSAQSHPLHGPIPSQPSKSVVSVSSQDRRLTEVKPASSSRSRISQQGRNNRLVSNVPNYKPSPNIEPQKVGQPLGEEPRQQPKDPFKIQQLSHEPKRYRQLPNEQRQPTVTAKNENVKNEPEVQVESSDSDTTDSIKPVTVKHVRHFQEFF